MSSYNSFDNIYGSGTTTTIPNITITDNTAGNNIYIYPSQTTIVPTQLPYYPPYHQPNIYPVIPNTAGYPPFIHNNYGFPFDIVPEELLSLMKELDIPVGVDNKISVAELAAIFNDQEKLQLLITKLKNPAFR